MTKKNPHIGSTFESWLDEAGIREEVTAAAVKPLRRRHRRPRAAGAAAHGPRPRSPRQLVTRQRHDRLGLGLGLVDVRVVDLGLMDLGVVDVGLVDVG